MLNGALVFTLSHSHTLTHSQTHSLSRILSLLSFIDDGNRVEQDADSQLVPSIAGSRLSLTHSHTLIHS